ncbi:MAG: hypothetical protein AAB546_03285 [Patescibacteria group bacterium]
MHIRSILKILAPLLLATFFVYLPFIVNPNLFVDRGNDLTEFFWPIYHFSKEQMLVTGQIPLWNNIFLSGTPLIPDPQAPFFYPPNIIFLFLPLNTGFLVSSFAHTLMAGVTAFLLARKGFKFATNTSILVGLFYLTSPKLMGYLEAGHVGLINSWAWLPVVILATIKLATNSGTIKQNFKWSILLAISMAGLFFTHSITFLLAGFGSASLFIFFVKKIKTILQLLISYSFSAVLCFGLIAISFLPQLAWSQLTTRTLLNVHPQVYPSWNTELEYLSAIFVPWMTEHGIFSLDSEKWIPLGTSLSLIAFGGFIKLKNKHKIAIVLLSFVILLISLNNLSPMYGLLIDQSWYAFIRVATRIWFIVVMLVIFLAGYFLDWLFKNNKWLTYPLAMIIITEQLLLSYKYIQKPVTPRQDIPQQIYELLAADNDHFRVYCLSRCIPQKQAALRKLELVEGYSTLTQLNYYKHSWSLTGGHWDYYSLLTPPLGLYLFTNLQPSAELLGDYSTKYVISPYILNDKNFSLINKFDDYYVYSNNLYQPRANVPISYYSANKIILDTTKEGVQTIILREVYSPGWNAYLDGTQKTLVQETPNAQRAIEIKPDTKFVEVKYEPTSFQNGRIISLATLIFLAASFLVSKEKIHFPKS